MTPQNIYDAIVNHEAISFKGAVALKMVCSFFDPCYKGFQCATFPKSKMIDFDLIEKNWHKWKGEPSQSSTDGLTYTAQYLCFIEAKGWKKFLEYQSELQKEIVSEKESERVQKRIAKQVQRYQFQKKLLDSISVCEEIVGKGAIMGNVPILYILVTDTNLVAAGSSQQDAAFYISQQLNFLANTSTKWKMVCTDKMRERFKEDTSGIKGIAPRFIQCKQLDGFLANPT